METFSSLQCLCNVRQSFLLHRRRQKKNVLVCFLNKYHSHTEALNESKSANIHIFIESTTNWKYCFKQQVREANAKTEMWTAATDGDT